MDHTNGNTFSMNRLLFSKTVQEKDVANKHFYGGETNRDASSVTQQRKIFEAGKKEPPSVKHETTNDVRQAKKRVRNGGSVVPAKKIHKSSTSPIFY